jgi:hypothetical protein
VFEQSRALLRGYQVKRNWAKIAIILLTITVVAGAVTPLFGDMFTGFFPSSLKTGESKSVEGKISATIDHAPSTKVETGQRSAVWEIGSFLLLGSGMLVLANWGKRKFRR